MADTQRQDALLRAGPAGALARCWHAQKPGSKPAQAHSTAQIYMRSQAWVCAVDSSVDDGSCTMMSPLEVVDHTACLEGAPATPRNWQQQSDNRDSWRHRTSWSAEGSMGTLLVREATPTSAIGAVRVGCEGQFGLRLPSRSCPARRARPGSGATSVGSVPACTRRRRSVPLEAAEAAPSLRSETPEGTERRQDVNNRARLH